MLMIYRTSLLASCNHFVYECFVVGGAAVVGVGDVGIGSD
jgi:hypothetical protein